MNSRINTFEQQNESPHQPSVSATVMPVSAFSIVSNLCVDTPIDREEGAASQEQEDEEHAAVLEAVQKKGVPNLRGVLTKLVAKLQ